MNDYSEDENELRLIKTGDAAYIKEVFFRRQEAFISFIASFFGCAPYLAKEVYPEAFARFQSAIERGRLSPPLRASLQTYLNTVGKNLYHKRHFNKFKKNESPTEQLPEQEKTNPIDQAHNNEAVKWLIRSLLDAIDEKCRKLLELYYIKGYASEVIATILDIEKPGTLRKRRFDCIQKLRKMMKQPQFKKFYP